MRFMEALDKTKQSEEEEAWTYEEKNRLIDLVDKHGQKWGKIQKSFPHRSPEAVENCWRSLRVGGDDNNQLSAQVTAARAALAIRESISNGGVAHPIQFVVSEQDSPAAPATLAP